MNDRGRRPVSSAKRAAERTPRQPAPVPEGEAETVTGTVEGVVYHSEQNGYTVCRVRLPSRKDPVTVVGTCATIWEGETLRATGRWVRHPRHGFQFQAESLTCVVPTSAQGIERYLAGGMIRGIGKVMARRLVEAFGDRTLEIIDKHSARLREVEGIGPKRRERIRDSWVEQHAVRDIMIFLQGHGMGVAQAARIYRRYGNQAVALITEDPYRLCRDVWGIGFKTADGMAGSLGVPRVSPVRARAGLEHVLQSQMEEGHCYCPVAELILQAQALLDIPAETLGEALREQIKTRRLVQDGENVYLTHLYQAEVEAAGRLRALLAAPAAFRPIVVDKAVPWAEKRMRLSFAPLQAEALRTALAEKVSIITGGPGVGKTTIIRALVDVFGARKLEVRLAAPTGRAAKRMEEATGRGAQTLHRMLKFLPREGRFEHGPDKPLSGQVFILDEVSMIDILLMRHLLAALPDEACLILVGDIDQLPSVGPGNVLRDLIHSGAVPCRRLETIFRQERGGWIVRNAHHVNRGESLEIPPEGADSSDFYFIESDGPELVIQRLLDLAARRIPRRFGFDPLDDIQVLTPMRRNQLGAENLNALLQEALNPGGPELQRFGRAYRVGDRVMQVRNNYDKDVFNGDIGRLAGVDMEDQRLTVDFDGRRVHYEHFELDELMHAFACTVHKSQGCEFPAVILLLTTQHFKLLQRNLLYTALTRGRRLVCLLGTRKALGMAIRNNEIRLRRTGLQRRLTAPGNLRREPRGEVPAAEGRREPG